MTGTFQDTSREHIAENKEDKIPAPIELTFYRGKNKQAEVEWTE